MKDFLHFFEVLNDHGVEFVCLKQNYDTTTPQGRLFVMIMMALAQFEREQTSERTSEATAARAERGLWNGGRLLGYDLDANRKGHLVPNADELTLVNFAFDTYLASGSVVETMKTLNGRGYRTKVFTSRRGVVHAGQPFIIQSVQYLLKNPAYIGKKVIKKGGRHLVDAIWPAIVDEQRFERAQRLMAANARTRHNGVRPIRHAYVLSPNLLHCGRCGSAMEGRSGTGRLKVKYFYYVCPNAECGLRASADEIEGAVIGRVQALARSDGLLSRIVEETNRRRARQRPTLLSRRRSLQKGLDGVKAEAEKVLAEWSALEAQAGRAFLADKLSDLAQRRSDLERGITEVDALLARMEREQVTTETVRDALSCFGEMPPYAVREEGAGAAPVALRESRGLPDRAGVVPDSRYASCHPLASHALGH